MVDAFVLNSSPVVFSGKPVAQCAWQPFLSRCARSPDHESRHGVFSSGEQQRLLPVHLERYPVRGRRLQHSEAERNRRHTGRSHPGQHGLSEKQHEPVDESGLGIYVDRYRIHGLIGLST